MPTLRTPQGHSIAIPPRRITVGEAPSSDIPISRGLGLAAMHFRLQPWKSGCFLEDCGSGLGTMVNGKLVSWVPLNDGDVITAGGLSLIYQTGDRSPLPAFPSSEVINPDLSLTDFPDGAAGEVTAKISESAPPSWLPAEALLPPATPVQIAAMQVPEFPKSRSRAGIVIGMLLVGAAVAFGLWFYFSRA